MHQLLNPDKSTRPFLFLNELRLLVLRFSGELSGYGGRWGGGESVHRLSDCLLVIAFIACGQLIPRLAT